MICFRGLDKQDCIAILAEGAIALSVTLSGGVLFAKPSTQSAACMMVVQVIPVNFSGLRPRSCGAAVWGVHSGDPGDHPFPGVIKCKQLTGALTARGSSDQQ